MISRFTQKFWKPIFVFWDYLADNIWNMVTYNLKKNQIIFVLFYWNGNCALYLLLHEKKKIYNAFSFLRRSGFSKIVDKSGFALPKHRSTAKNIVLKTSYGFQAPKTRLLLKIIKNTYDKWSCARYINIMQIRIASNFACVWMLAWIIITSSLT